MKKKSEKNNEFRKGHFVQYVDDVTKLKKVGEIKKVLKNGRYKLKGLIGEFSEVTHLNEEGVSWLLFQQGVREYMQHVDRMNTFFRHRGFSPISL